MIEGCNVQNPEWYPIISGAEKFPIRVVYGTLYLEDGKKIGIPRGAFEHAGWGQSSGFNLVGSAEKALPAKMSIVWFSFIENKFFSAELELPTQTIKTFLTNNLSEPPKSSHRLIIGMAPRGNLSVWFKVKKVKFELVSFKAKEIDFPWLEFTPQPSTPREEWLAALLLGLEIQVPELPEDDQNNGAVHKDILIWDKYPERYHWQTEVEGTKLTSMFIQMMNGELEYIEYDQDDNNTYFVKPFARVDKAVPKKMTINWLNSLDGREYQSVIYFNEKETMQAYQKFTESDDLVNFKMLLEISEKTGKIEIYIKDKKLFLKLEEFESAIYS